MPERVPLHWHLARWRREAPGPRGLLWIAAVTLLLMLPVERFGADLSWATQARILVNLGVALAAIAIGRDAGRPDDAERWLLLQGQSPADWALARWVANLLPLALLAVLWAAIVFTVTALTQEQPMPWSGVLGLALHLALTAMLLTLILLTLGCLGARQTAEGMMLLLILTFLLPLVADRLPAVVADGARLVLPPLDAIATFRDAATDGAWRELLNAALRLATWSGVLLALALTAANRRVPARPSRVSVTSG
ncbi:MAG: hypothetical protein C0503_02620 [Gemmatimonas sp.]|nr:hypothetical protein [Gemmatimonas sp.]